MISQVAVWSRHLGKVCSRLGFRKIAFAGIIVAMNASCEPTPCEQRWGYFLTHQDHYEIQDPKYTPGGVTYDDEEQNVDFTLLDRYTDEVEDCLGKSIDRTSFRVKVPSNWSLSCDGTDQVLSATTFPQGCWAKGLEPTASCPCRYRAYIQCPNIIVAAPNLLLYKDALIRFVTGSRNPWAEPVICANP